ncbi:MAG: hypothetical protein RJA34_2881 [Pseudomonadota bacterium]
MKLGVCYYPEHWPEAWWADDARRMREMGISVVRIAEFAWSRIEPSPGVFDWAWLDRAIDTLHAQGLGVVMCTPTATPPKWLIDAEPETLAWDLQGQPRGFGSRRHYCFSSPGYRAQSRRICRQVAERYGQHPAVVAWQTDNEYGCHDTILSTSPAARAGFRRWLAVRYGTVDALNTAWGTVFWSQEYRSFDEVDLPTGTVTEANPSNRLDWRRFASDEVVAFNREQVEILRACSPGRPVSHNFMGFFTEFNHHDVAADLDIATWDSYPLGFTQNFFLTAAEKVRWARTGHPDIPAFHHDLYRGMCAGGRWWVMEQQPGPVNWAQWNPAPLDGMVRLWTWQAFAHGAEVVSYFRWRQAPFAQEQMHTGLHRPDRSLDQGGVEATQVGQELQALAAQIAPNPPDLATGAAHLRVYAPVALVFDYESLWMSQIQPHGADYNALELSFRVYSALRGLGLDVDIVSPHAPLGSYRLVVLPAQWQVPASLLQQLTNSTAHIVLGPRAGSKTPDLQVPQNLAPGPLQALAGLQVQRVASLPPGMQETVRWTGPDAPPDTVSTRWREDWLLQGAQAEAQFDDGRAAVARHERTRSVAAWLDDAGWRRLLKLAAHDAGLTTLDLPQRLRVSRIGALTVVCNFSNQVAHFAPPEPAQALLGSAELAPCSVAIWRS